MYNLLSKNTKKIHFSVPVKRKTDILTLLKFSIFFMKNAGQIWEFSPNQS